MLDYEKSSHAIGQRRQVRQERFCVEVIDISARVMERYHGYTKSLNVYLHSPVEREITQGEAGQVYLSIPKTLLPKSIDLTVELLGGGCGTNSRHYFV